MKQRNIKSKFGMSQALVDGKRSFETMLVIYHKSILNFHFLVPLVGEARVINIGGCPACRVSPVYQSFHIF